MMDKLLGSLPDNELMCLAAGGDEKAFVELYNRYRVRLILFISQCLGHNESGVAEDLAHDVWAKLFKARNRYAPTAKFYTYLCKIACRVVIDYKRGRRKKTGKEVEASPELSNEVERVPVEEPCSDLSRDLDKILDKLPVKERHVVELRGKFHFTWAEIAEKLRENKETIRGRWKRACKRLLKDGEHLRIYCETNLVRSRRKGRRRSPRRRDLVGAIHN